MSNTGNNRGMKKMMNYHIVVSDAGELKTVTREDIKRSIERAGYASGPGLQQIEFVLDRVLDQRAADEEAAEKAVQQALIAPPTPTHPEDVA